jgi:hypothetical protein
MENPDRARNHLIATAALFCAMATLCPAMAQQSPPSLDEILQRLELNLEEYRSDVPSFFCDEHVVSMMSPPWQQTVTDSAFRLKREVGSEGGLSFFASRELKKVDGYDAAGEVLRGPAIVSGAFSGGYAVVSLSQKACMRYTLHPGKPDEPYMVSFVTVPSTARPPDCLLRDDASGSVLIDPVTMQVKQVEIVVPRHTIIPSGETYTFTFSRKTIKSKIRPAIVGQWTVSIGYAPVVLDGHSFWLPSTITSNARSAKFSLDRAIWGFDARYSNYHKLEVTSRIVPGSIAPVPLH